MISMLYVGLSMCGHNRSEITDINLMFFSSTIRPKVCNFLLSKNAFKSFQKFEPKEMN